MAFDSNVNPEGQQWLDVCTTEYDRPNNVINCRCPSIKNWYFAIVTDFNRVRAREWVEDLTFNWQFLLILLPLIFIGIFVPFKVSQYDEVDWASLGDYKYEVSDDLLRFIKLKGDYPFYAQVIYKSRLIETISKDQEPELSFRTAYSLIRKTSHPVFGLVYWFDYQVPRLFRSLLLILQVSGLTIKCFLWSSGPLGDWLENALGPENLGWRPVLIALMIGLFSFPLP
jgi:hypothetical protein